jgi:hypothetical protein
MSVLSHADDGADETRCKYRVMPTMVLPSHAGDGAAEVI